MMKVLLIFLFSFNIFAQSFTWFGTTHTLIKIGKDYLMFDPFITHPSPMDLVFRRNIKSDKKLVKKWLDKASVDKVDAIFVNHAHYDHVMDFGTILNMFKAKGYGSQSAINYALGENVPSSNLKVVTDQSQVIVGDHQITVLKGKHPAHILGKTFMDGKIKEPLKGPKTAWDMQKGESLVFFIKNNQGNIFFHPFANKSPYIKDYSKYKAKILFLGISKRSSTLDQIADIVRPTGAQIVIPIHYDNFFTPLKENPSEHLIANMDEWYKTFEKKIPEVKVIKPQIAKWISLE